MTLLAFAAERTRRVPDINRYLLQTPGLSSKPAAHRRCCRSTGQTDGRTHDRYINLAVHTTRAASIIGTAIVLCIYRIKLSLQPRALIANIVYQRVTTVVSICFYTFYFVSSLNAKNIIPQRCNNTDSTTLARSSRESSAARSRRWRRRPWSTQSRATSRKIRPSLRGRFAIACSPTASARRKIFPASAPLTGAC